MNKPNCCRKCEFQDWAGYGGKQKFVCWDVSCECHKQNAAKPISTPTEGWREALEKIAWKHYDPHSSINVEEMLDEMAPVITQEKERSYLQGRKEAEKEMLRRFQQFWAEKFGMQVIMWHKEEYPVVMPFEVDQLPPLPVREDGEAARAPKP